MAAAVALAGSRRARTIAVAVIAIEPLLRTGTYFAYPSIRALIPVMGHTRIDTLLFGCVLALLQADAAWCAWLRRWIRGPVVVGALAVVIGSTWLLARFAGKWQLPVGWSCEGLAIAVLVFRSMGSENAVTRVLNAAPVAWLGRISYSLYIWQQPWLAREGFWMRLPLPLCLAGATTCAIVSYYFVEQPMLRVRGRLIDARRREARAAPRLSGALGHTPWRGAAPISSDPPRT